MPGPDRRRAARRVPRDDEPIARARLRTGWDLTVIDVSDHGALVEGSARLLPGTHVDAHIVTSSGRVLVRCRVARAYVCHVQKDAVHYRGALSFERRVDTWAHGYPVPGVVAGSPSRPGTDYPDNGGAEGGVTDETL